MNEQNMRPEQVRQAELFQRREELTWEAHRLSQEAPNPELRERLENYRTKILRDLIDRYHKDWTPAQKEARMRELLSQPIPERSASVPKSTAAPAKVRTDSAKTWKAASSAPAQKRTKHDAAAWELVKKFYDQGNLEMAPERVRRWCQEDGIQIRTCSSPLTVSK